MRNIWFHGFKVMCILCTRLTGMTKLVGDVMGKLLDFTEKAKKIVEDLEPGDLIFYGSGISHVALYIGNGQIIHASTSASGIKISNYDYEAPVGVGTYIEADGFFSE